MTFSNLSKTDLQNLFAAARPVGREILRSELGMLLGNIADAALDEAMDELEAPIIAMAGKP